jgi:hypothetical protein
MPNRCADLLVAVMFPMVSRSQVKAEVPADGTQSSRMDLDVSPLVAMHGAPDPLPELGIHTGRNAIPPRPSREEKIEKAAHWLKAAAGASPLLIESGDIGYVVHLTGDAQLLQQLKDAVEKVNPPNAPHVVFDCRVFTMSNEAMAKLDASVRKKLLAAMVPGSVNAESITNEERVALVKSATTTITAPRLVMFDGQSAYAIVSTQRAFVANVTKVAARKPATQPAYEPEIGIADSGVAVGAKVDMKPADKTIAVQVKTQITRLLELKSALADPDDKNTNIQVPTLESIKFNQLCTVADGESILCHGERELINGPTTQPIGDDVFFIITATIIQPKPAK